MHGRVTDGLAISRNTNIPQFSNFRKFICVRVAVSKYVPNKQIKVFKLGKFLNELKTRSVTSGPVILSTSRLLSSDNVFKVLSQSDSLKNCRNCNCGWFPIISWSRLEDITFRCWRFKWSNRLQSLSWISSLTIFVCRLKKFCNDTHLRSIV